MPKISEYTLDNSPSPTADYFLIAYGGQNYKVKIGNASFFPQPYSVFKIAEDDFFVNQKNFQVNGTWSNQDGEANHPGILRGNTTGAITPSFLNLNDFSHLIAGGEVFECIFRPVNVSATTKLLFGFLDSRPTPVDGAWIQVDAATLAGKTANNSTTSTSTSSYTVSVSTWYRVKVEVNSGATLVTFSLYSEAGVLLWSDTLATNIPIAAGRETSVHAYGTHSGASQDTFDVDWLTFYIKRTLTR